MRISLASSIPRAVVLALVAAAPAFGQGPAAGLLERLNGATEQITVFENVSVVPMDSERVLPNQTVIIRSGRIYAIGPTDDRRLLPAEAQRIDGRGKYLIPGLADMHFHLPGPNAKPGEIDAYLMLFVASGVTTVRSTIGQSNHIAVRDQVRAGKRFGPDLYLASYPIHSKQATADAARELVFRSKAEGFDLVKLFDVTDTTVFDAAIQAAREVSLPAFGHVKSEIGIDRALRSGQSVEHLSGYLKAVQADEKRLPALAQATVDARVWNCPTEFFFECLYERDLGKVSAYEGVAVMPLAVREDWTKKKREEIAQQAARADSNQRELTLRRKIIKTLHDGGAKLLLSSDTPGTFAVPGYAVIEEARAFARAGLSPYAVLETGTRNPAEYLGILDEAGTVQVGKRADLVLLEANPLESVDHLGKRAGVMLRGAWFGRAELDAAAKAAAATLR